MEIVKLFEENEIRIFKDKNEKFWFVGRDAANLLEYKNTRKAILDNVNDRYKCKMEDFMRSNPQLLFKFNIHPHTILINELGLYTLVMKSNKKKALEVQDWFTMLLNKYEIPVSTS